MTAARINFLHAREANVTVILRRGPSKWVQVLKWNTDSDLIEQGQWFNGRIYPEKSDLSPCGNYMIYFAAKFKKDENQYAWTAISRPPFLTAIALWKKKDTFDGGGLFESDKKIYLNHRKVDAIPERSVDGLEVTINKTAWPIIYDIEFTRLTKNNWVWSKEPSSKTGDSTTVITKKVNDGCDVVHKGVPIAKHKYHWNTFIKNNGELLALDGFENIDVNLNGRILMSKEGCIYSIDDIDSFFKNKEPKFIVDLNENVPYQLEAPEEMKKW